MSKLLNRFLNGLLSGCLIQGLFLCAADVLSWLARCAAALKPGGLVVVKENICSGERFVTDDEDSSLTRSDAYLQVSTEVTNKAGV